jgi:hypothetical protein
MLAFPNSVHYLDNAKLLYYRIHDGNTLSEAAITGREQDLEVIGKYMIARVPDNLKPLVQTGTHRLRQLEKEISDVKLELSKPRPGVGTPTPTFRRRVKNKLCRMFCH